MYIEFNEFWFLWDQVNLRNREVSALQRYSTDKSFGLWDQMSLRNINKGVRTMEGSVLQR